MRVLGLIMVGIAFTATPAAAETLTVSLSSHRIIINSNFTGTDVVLFGAIGRDGGSASRTDYDLAVTIRGPRRDVVVREKERVAGFWINTGSLTIPQIPEYLAVMSSKPLTEIADAPYRQKLMLGLEENLPLPPSRRMSADEVHASRDALIRLKQEEKRFIANPRGVTFLNESLFRTSIPMPANVPIGTFDVEVKLFSGGVVLATQTTALEVVKSGFEANVADVARDDPWIYGFIAALLAIACGWLASVAFRRD